MSFAAVQHRMRATSRRMPTIADAGGLVTYSLTLAGLYLSVGFLFYYSAVQKLITDGGSMPFVLQMAFKGSFFSSVPGNSAAWVLLGILEACIVVLLASSLIVGEFLPQRRKPLLLTGLGVAMFAFALMIVANAMIGDQTNVFELFAYLGATGVVMFLIHQLPPYRPLSWFGGRAVSER
jgi:hypothetical protein